MPRILSVDDDTAGPASVLGDPVRRRLRSGYCPFVCSRKRHSRFWPPFRPADHGRRVAGGTGSALADKATGRGVPMLVMTGNTLGIDSPKYQVLAKPLRAEALPAAVATTLKDYPQ